MGGDELNVRPVPIFEDVPDAAAKIRDRGNKRGKS
jgi:hypothetical protein